MLTQCFRKRTGGHCAGELALIAAVLINSFGVVLMLYSGAGDFSNLKRAVCIFRSLY